MWGQHVDQPLWSTKHGSHRDPRCCACSMSHSLFLASAKCPTAKLTRHQIPPPPVRADHPVYMSARWG